MSEALAAFGPTAPQNILASFASHSLKKTVFFRAVTIFWLVGSFWHNLFLKLYHSRGKPGLRNRKINNVYPTNSSNFSTPGQVFSTVLKGSLLRVYNSPLYVELVGFPKFNTFRSVEKLV
jgi:hypothetical protein